MPPAATMPGTAASQHVASVQVIDSPVLGTEEPATASPPTQEPVIGTRLTTASPTRPTAIGRIKQFSFMYEYDEDSGDGSLRTIPETIQESEN